MLLFSSGPTFVSAQTVVIRAGHLVDVVSGTAIEGQFILVQDGKIVGVGTSLDIP